MAARWCGVGVRVYGSGIAGFGLLINAWRLCWFMFCLSRSFCGGLSSDTADGLVKVVHHEGWICVEAYSGLGY